MLGIRATEKLYTQLDMPLDPGTLLGHYKIGAPIGAGGMGEVYRATDTKLGRDVAVKIIPEALAADPDRMARFTREAQVLASLNHPNIAAIYGVEERALILELVEGEMLAGPMNVAEVLKVARQIAEALECAHEKGIIHRDLKPANIKLTPEGRVKVLDFGLAKALSADGSASDPTSSPTLTMRATIAGVIMGTAAYMSPEQARGAPTDRRADIWAFGVVLYELLTGHQIFGGDTVSDSLAAVLKTDPKWSALPPDTPIAIRRLLRRCLERDRKKRLSDIGDARLEIDEALAAPAETPPTPAAVPERRASGVNWWSTAALALLALGGIALAIVHFREAPPEPAPVRFHIPAPEKASFGNYGMALSPDGRKLAFISFAGGNSMLWVRSLDSLTAQALPGTEGAAFLPFWSPDSRFVGFFVQSKLKKIDVSGGPAQTLCELAGNALIGGSWSRDGVIVFGYNEGGLYRVSQAGGVPTKITTADASQGEIGHLRPWFLPDGRHFLYFSRGGQPAIYLASLDGTAPKRLVNATQAGAYAPPAAGSGYGHLLFLREGTLMAQTMHPRSLLLVGEPFPVAEQVGFSLAMGFFSASANGVLAYRSGTSVGITRLSWFDREGKVLGSINSAGPPPNDLALSPDGKHLAVSQTGPTGNTDVWVVDVARGIPTRFTFDSAVDTHPVWSPDGHRLVFGSSRAGSQSLYDIYEKDASGAGTEQLLLKSGLPNHWSPDGRYLLFDRVDPQSKDDLWVVPAASQDRKAVPYAQTPANERQGQFSTDGRWVAYISDETAPGQYQVYVQSFPPGSGKFQVSTGTGGVQPRWRRDGKEIFYLSRDGHLMAAEVKISPGFEAGTPRALFDARILGGVPNANGSAYDVAPDGKRFVVSSLAEADNSAPTPITVVVNWQAAVKH